MNPDSTHLSMWIRIWIEKYATGSELKSSCERGYSSSTPHEHMASDVITTTGIYGDKQVSMMMVTTAGIYGDGNQKAGIYGDGNHSRYISMVMVTIADVALQLW